MNINEEQLKRDIAKLEHKLIRSKTHCPSTKDLSALSASKSII